MRWLVLGGLKFVLARKVGKEDVDEEVYSCRDEEVISRPRCPGLSRYRAFPA